MLTRAGELAWVGPRLQCLRLLCPVGSFPSFAVVVALAPSECPFLGADATALSLSSPGTQSSRSSEASETAYATSSVCPDPS